MEKAAPKMVFGSLGWKDSRREVSLEVIRGGQEGWRERCRELWQSGVFRGCGELLEVFEQTLQDHDAVSPAALSAFFALVSCSPELWHREEHSVARFQPQLERVVSRLIDRGARWDLPELYDALGFGVGKVLVERELSMEQDKEDWRVRRGEFLKDALLHPFGGEVLEAIFRFYGEGRGLFPSDYYPLHNVAGRGSLKTLEVLWRWGFDLDEGDSEGKTPIHWAILGAGVNKGREEVLRFLLEKGADPNRCDSWGRSPLVQAVSLGCLEGIEILLEFGANPFEEVRGGGYIAAHFLYGLRLYRGKEKALDLARYLIPDWQTLKELRKERWICPISISLASTGVKEFIEIALEKGIDPTDPAEMTSGGFSALNGALEKRNVETAKLLIRVKGLFGDLDIIIRDVPIVQDLEILEEVLQRLEGPLRDRLIKEVLGSEWGEGASHLLDLLPDLEERAEQYFKWTTRRKVEQKSEAILKLAGLVSRESLERLYDRLIKRSRFSGPLVWALGAMLGRDEMALEGLKAL